MLKAVLSAIPQHQLLVMGIYKKAKQVTKILRGLPWKGIEGAQGDHCLINWAKVCQPMQYKRLGVHELALTSISLCVCWLWRMHLDPSRPWRGLDMQFTKTVYGASALFWMDRWLDGGPSQSLCQSSSTSSLVPHCSGGTS